MHLLLFIQEYGRNLLDLALVSIGYKNIDSVDEDRANQHLSVEQFQGSLDKTHKNVNETLSSERKNTIQRHNNKTHVIPCTISVGDYVVVARYHGPRTEMTSNWVFPS